MVVQIVQVVQVVDGWLVVNGERYEMLFVVRCSLFVIRYLLYVIRKTSAYNHLFSDL